MRKIDPKPELTDKQLTELASISETFDILQSQIGGFKSWLDIKDRRLEEVARDYPKYRHASRELLAAIKFQLEKAEVVQSSIEGRMWRWYNEFHPRELNTRDMQAYLNTEDSVQDVKQVIVNFNYIKAQSEAIVDAFESMNWMISNITKIRVEQLQEEII